MGTRRMVACVCLVVLVIAWALRWEKSSAREGLVSMTYLRDRWLGQSYVQSWGAARYGGDGQGTAVPVFSEAQTSRYISGHVTDEERACALRYFIVKGQGPWSALYDPVWAAPRQLYDDETLTEEGKELLTRYHYSTTRYDLAKPFDPGEEGQLAARVVQVESRLEEDLGASAYLARDVATSICAVCAVASFAFAATRTRTKDGRVGGAAREH